MNAARFFSSTWSLAAYLLNVGLFKLQAFAGDNLVCLECYNLSLRRYRHCWKGKKKLIYVYVLINDIQKKKYDTEAKSWKVRKIGKTRNARKLKVILCDGFCCAINVLLTTFIQIIFMILMQLSCISFLFSPLN